MKRKNRINVNAFFHFFVFITILLIPQKQSLAFIPNVYEPNPKELFLDSIKIGRAAEQLIQLGEAKEAIRFIKLAIKLNPDEERIWLILAEAQIKLKRFKKADQTIDKAISINPLNEKNWFRKGSILIQLKNPKNAINSIQKGLSLNSNNENGYFQLGNAYIMLSKFDLSLKAFKKASKIKSDFWQAINNEGIVLYELNDKNKAIIKWQEAMRITNDPEPMLALAVALHERNKNNIKSIELAKKALAKNPNYVYDIYQQEQLWGTNLRQATQKFFREKQMNEAIEKAKANSK